MEAIFGFLVLILICFGVYYMIKADDNTPDTGKTRAAPSKPSSYRASRQPPKTTSKATVMAASKADETSDKALDAYLRYAEIEKLYADDLIRRAKIARDSNALVDSRITAIKEMQQIYKDFKNACQNAGAPVHKEFRDMWERFRSADGANFSYMAPYKDLLANLKSRADTMRVDETVRSSVLPSLQSDVLAVIKKNDGIKQTELYKMFDGCLKSDIQSLLYMLGSCGKVFRTKAGSTYALSLIDKSETLPYVPSGQHEAAKNALSNEERAFCSTFLNKIKTKAQGKDLPNYDICADLPLHMISPMNKAVAPMIHYPHFLNLHFLDKEELQYVYLLMYLAGRSMDKSNGYEMNGVSQAMFPDADRAITMLWALGFIHDGDATEARFSPSPLGYVMLLSLYYDRAEKLEDIKKMQQWVTDEPQPLLSLVAAAT